MTRLSARSLRFYISMIVLAVATATRILAACDPLADHDSDGLNDCVDPWTICAPEDNGSLGIQLPNPNYVTFQAPSKGGSYTDMALGCSVKRLTDGEVDFSAEVRHEYSVWSPFNSDVCHLLVESPDPAPPSMDDYLVIDLNGNIVRGPAELKVKESETPRWSRTNPSLFYHARDNQIMTYDVAAGTGAVLFTVTAYAGLSIKLSDISEDADHVVISAREGAHPLKKHRLFTLSSLVLGPQISGGFTDIVTPPLVTRADCEITPSNNILCAYDRSDGTMGLDLFNGSSGALIRNVLTRKGHSDVGHDPTDSGAEVYVYVNDGLAKGTSNGCVPPGIEKVRLSDSARTCLLSLTTAAPGGAAWWGKSIHVSINNVGGHPWVLVSANDHKSGGADDTRDFDPLPSNWTSLWGKYFNEILLVSMHGNPTDRQIHRLAHTRSRDGNSLDPADSGYWSLPRASLSHDGKYVVFDSNYNDSFSYQSGRSDYTDVYLVRTLWDPAPDGDADGIPDHCDNCPTVYNPAQNDPTSPAVTVLYPTNSGLTFTTGQSVNLQWTASDTCGGATTVDILLSRSGINGPYNEVLFDNTLNDGAQQWAATGPPAPGFNKFVKVVAQDPGGTGSDTSNNGFKIVSPPCGPCTPSSYCSQEGIRCTWDNTCGAGGCCNYTCTSDPSCTGSDPCPENICGGCF